MLLPHGEKKNKFKPVKIIFSTYGVKHILMWLQSSSHQIFIITLEKSSLLILVKPLPPCPLFGHY